MALASVSVADAAKAVDDKTFFSGAHLGMTLDECYAYYDDSVADGGIAEHSGAPRGERQIDFRTDSNPMRRVYVYVRKKDRKIVSVTYWKWEKMKPSLRRRYTTSGISIAGMAL